MPLASAIMDEAASLLNDTAKEKYSYIVQLPYLKSAWNKLQLRLQEAGIDVAKETSAVIDVALTIANTGTITLPNDFLQPIDVSERQDGSSALFQEVKEIDTIPEMDQLDNIIYWTWREETLEINAPKTNREVKLHYWKSLNPATSSSSNLNVINSLEYLANKTASLCAFFVGENPSRGVALNNEATEAIDILINLEVKRKQSLPVRPSGYGNRSNTKMRLNKIQV